MPGILLEHVPPLSAVLITALKATVLLALAIAIRGTLRRSAASAHYFIACAFVVLAATLPLLAPLAPDWRPTLPASVQTHLISRTSPSHSPDAAVHSLASASSPVGSVAGIESPVPPSHATSKLLLTIWLFGGALVTGRVLFGITGCARIRRRAGPVTSRRIRRLVREASDRVGLRPPPAVITGSQPWSPFVGGIVTPVLYLPCDVLRWPEERLMSILLHEFNHLKRRDHITWPLLQIAASWLWFNPLLWVVLAYMKRDRERACDDRSIGQGRSIADYAQHLLEACASLQHTARLAPAAQLLSRTPEVERRIEYMFKRSIKHRTMNRVQRTVLTVLPVIAAIPLIGLRGFSSPISGSDLTAQEGKDVMAALTEFYTALSDGVDYDLIREDFLTSDYFDPSHLTLENLDPMARRSPFANTLFLIGQAGVGVAKEVRTRILSTRRDGEELVVTQQLNIIADRVPGAPVSLSEEGTIIRSPRPGVAVEECHLVRNLIQQIRLRQEDGFWKIAQFDDGVTIMRMDTDNPNGPILLVWMEDIDRQTTPFGAGVFKVFPHDLIPDARNTLFVLEE